MTAMKTKKVWCDECKITVFDCEHLTGRNAAPEVPEDLPRDPGKRGLVFLSFNENIPAFYTANVCANPQLAVKPRRLVVDPVIAPYFKILDIKIGRNSQFASCTGGGVGASIFPPVPAKYQPIANLDGLPIVEIGANMIIQIYNQGSSIQNFNALVWCDFAIEKPIFLSPSELMDNITGRRHR